MGNTLIERIDAELARTGLNDESASKKAGLHRDTIRDLRRGKRRMLNAENLAALAEVLGTTTAHLLGHWEDDPDSNDSPAAFSRYLSKRYGGSEGAYFRESYAPKIQGAIPELDVRLGAGEGSVGEVLVLPINGDTLELNGETIRLEGIDAPEMRQDCKDSAGATYRCGRAARRALERMAQGVVTCAPSGKDRYSRTLAYCATAETDLNRRMVIDGWAFAFVKYNDRYLTEEAAARTAGRGIWSGEAQPPWDWRAAQIAAFEPTGECVIKGNISGDRRTYYMPFHQMYKRVKVDEAAGERWFCTEDEALAAGWTRANR